MRFLILSLFLLLGLQQILGRSIWSPYDFDDDDDLFEMHSADFPRDFHRFTDPDYEDLKGFLGTFSKDIDELESKEISDIEDNKYDPEEKWNKETKMEEPEAFNNDDVITITDEQLLSDIEDMIRVLQVVNAINEIIKNVPVPEDDINDSVEAQEEYSSKEKDLKAFEDFVNTLIEFIEEESRDEDNIATTTKKDSSEEDDEVSTTPPTDSSEEENEVTTTPATDSSEEEKDDTTTPATDSSEEEKEVTTPTNDSSEEKEITTTKPDSDENNDGEDDAFVYHIIDFNEPSENLDGLKYEIIENSPNTVENMPSFSSPLYNELDELKSIKRNLKKNTYNTISRNNKDESLENYKNDVVVFHEKFNRFKRHINENRNSKLFYRNLVATKVKNLLNKI